MRYRIRRRAMLSELQRVDKVVRKRKRLQEAAEIREVSLVARTSVSFVINSLSETVMKRKRQRYKPDLQVLREMVNCKRETQTGTSWTSRMSKTRS